MLIMAKVKKYRKNQVIDDLNTALVNNGVAQRLDTKKSWTLHDLKTIQPKTPNQKTAIEFLDQYDAVLLDGSAGTGKSFLAFNEALRSVIVKKTHTSIMIVRSAVPSRDQGFLPGT
jgi:predicted ribonuclease YlaK